MAATPRRNKRVDDGFTLIELLIVVLIIGILAAIAIPLFLGQQKQARDAAAKSDLGTARVALISYASDHNGTYTTTISNLTNYGYTNTPGNTATSIILGATRSRYCIQTTSSSTSAWKITDRTGVIRGACVAADVT